jgi:hypothetical protein
LPSHRSSISSLCGIAHLHLYLAELGSELVHCLIV